ncbi:hypothetical protein HPB52_025694 [Rhipicephalus sanguineus]|uniref:Endonuclease/exonuclease/phosphatase domain-containing protein n=1 Tax=Rhipicephalus sanguineus TaxID=34632 RepID=A0A9D4TCN6_RHISA|nr:hypothetical protein HPB52_025694 [Rhipicephalus sanguineus]
MDGGRLLPKNVETLGCVERDIQTIGLPTIIIGDFNAHIEDLDGKTDRMGRYLLDWADKEGLVILNTSDKCVGKTTWAVSDKQTCIDMYCLVSPIQFPRVVGMSIDTTGAQSVGSDHNSIWIELSSSYRPRPGVERKERHHALPEWAIDKLVETLENSVEQVDTDEYDVFEQWVVDNINSVTKTSNPATKTQKHRRKAWWDKEVSEALFKRKQACRAHRQALKHGSTGDNILQLWEAYRVAKRHMASVVQKKMRAINVRLLQNIKKAGKDSAKKFWQYIGTQQPPVPQTQASLQDPDTGQALSEEECLRLVEKHFSAKFHSMASAAEDTDPETRKSLSPCDTITARELERAIRHLSGNTAAGLDRIPALLLKKMGSTVRQLLLAVLNRVLLSGEIPKSWNRSRIRLILKKGSDKRHLESYRPIAVTSVLYRLFCCILRQRMMSWAEESLEREAGRAALGVHKGVPNEAVQGEVGWSSFEAREAVSKLAYERRLSQLPDGRWAREVFKYIHLKCINTKWVLRTKRLAERYEVAPCRLTEKPQWDRRTKVREAVQEAESASWRTMVAGKPALSFYSKAKQAIEKEPLYENSKGSGLLCEARCGMLRTRLLRATYTPNLDTTCPLCTLEEESIEHIVLRCPALKPQVSATSSAAATPPEQRQKLLAMALGFRESQEQPQWETVEATKRRLEHWWCANYLQDRTGPAANTPNQ